MIAVVPALVLIALSANPLRGAETPELDINRAEIADQARMEGDTPSQVHSAEEAEAATDRSGSSPMMLEILDVVERNHAKTRELEAQITASTNEATILTLQRRIEKLAQETELEILRVQARHARIAGREDLAVRIEKAIAEILSPPVRRVKADRPAPESH